MEAIEKMKVAIKRHAKFDNPRVETELVQLMDLVAADIDSLDYEAGDAVVEAIDKFDDVLDEEKPEGIKDDDDDVDGDDDKDDPEDEDEIESEREEENEEDEEENDDDEDDSRGKEDDDDDDDDEDDELDREGVELEDDEEDITKE